ncbi:thiol:disulfide interchange protein [hydrothermal vent metagenome]|uniref:Thiol:disulfide interchange protein n=1 Tax=hydrothermal vent metagenome TaxID=652676 RepID=A0A1W1CC61_9ZZZZ
MTKKILTMGILTMVSLASATDIITDKAKLDEIKSISKVFLNPALEIKAAIDKDSVYFIKAEGKSPNGSQKIMAFVDKKTGAVYFGNGVDKEGKLLKFPSDAKVIKDGVSFSYGSGKKEIYLVTDPECPYCKRFEKNAQGKLKDYTVHVILFPLSFHKKSPAMVEWIMQGKDDAERADRFKKIMLDGSTEYSSLIKDAKKPFNYSDDTKEKMERSASAVQELGARGTPMVFDDSFNGVSQEELFSTKQK